MSPWTFKQVVIFCRSKETENQLRFVLIVLVYIPPATTCSLAFISHWNVPLKESSQTTLTHNTVSFDVNWNRISLAGALIQPLSGSKAQAQWFDPDFIWKKTHPRITCKWRFYFFLTWTTLKSEILEQNNNPARVTSWHRSTLQAECHTCQFGFIVERHVPHLQMIMLRVRSACV